MDVTASRPVMEASDVQPEKAPFGRTVARRGHANEVNAVP